MKIVYIATSIIPSRTANSIHVMKMCQAFAQNGHEVTLIIPDQKNEQEPGVRDVYEFYGVEKCFEIIRLRDLPTRVGKLMNGWFAARIAANIKPDIIYSRDEIGSYCTAMRGLPVIFESHSPHDSRVFSERILKMIFSRLIQSSSFQKLVVITNALDSYYVAAHPSLSGRIQIAPDGADTVPFNVQPALLPKNGQRLQVGYVGHLYTGKGMEVISRLVDHCDWADFHIIGGTDHDIAYWRNHTGNKPNQLFYGFIPHAETIPYILSFDVCLIPNQRRVSGYDGIGDIGQWTSPLKLFEYMAAGKAIICSDLPVLREVLEDGRNAILCDPENVDEWEKALLRLHNDKELQTRLGKTAQEDFLTNYTWKSRAQNVLLAKDDTECREESAK